ncbi:MAG: MBL fold metallo-hydrolase [Cytophagales bacterium]|nr:MBL fold metallo-hydrolase [Bernardetiaceae bacterium]MDW8205637.1 MBL fold metallo-hydrolase [Cytophagales bacterium]
MQLHTIETGFFKLDGGAMFGVVPKTIWQNLNPADANNMCTWAMRCLLIETGNRLVLVDNGIGNKQSEKFFSHYYLHGEASLQSSLQHLGIHFQDITDALLTHLHFDHCGGGVVRTSEGRLIPTFPQAVYWTNQAHWQWATQPNAREKASFLPENLLPMQESGQLQMVQLPPLSSTTPLLIPFAEGIELLFVDGHTEKQMLPLVSFKGRKILFCGDLLPSSAHIPLPYVMAYDVRPLLTLQEKEWVLNRALAEDWVLFFEHDPVHECCTLQQTEKGIRPKEFFRLRELSA